MIVPLSSATMEIDEVVEVFDFAVQIATHTLSLLSLSKGHGLDMSDPSTHVDRSEILTRPQ